MRRIALFLVSLVICLFIAGQVLAITITDVYPTDLNTIGVYYYPQVVDVPENYSETHLVPYTSHDGYGIVNGQGQFFDKVVTFDENDLVDPNWIFQFWVMNSSPYIWSDYHFEFWDVDFDTPLEDFPLTGSSNFRFQNNAFDGTELQFWAPGWHNPGSVNPFDLYINLNLVNGGASGSFGIRQVATTDGSVPAPVPEPGTLLLLGFGLAGLVGYAKFRINRSKK